MLAGALKALDELGVPRVLHMVRDAADRDIGSGKGLRGWCFDRNLDRDAGLLIASRLHKHPFVDGENGLFSEAEGSYAVEARVAGERVFGLGLAGMNGGFVVALASALISSGMLIPVALTYVTEEEERADEVEVLRIVKSADVQESRSVILEMLDRAIKDGRDLAARLSELFPCLLFGLRALEPIVDLRGTEAVFPQLLRHLRALDRGADHWLPGTPFTPFGSVKWSPESQATLGHGKYGPMRDFPVPNGFAAERWSLHTKPTGGSGTRLYFRPDRAAGVVLIGYFGAHLPSVEYPT